jgi:hypothetical protein
MGNAKAKNTKEEVLPPAPFNDFLQLMRSIQR